MNGMLYLLCLIDRTTPQTTQRQGIMMKGFVPLASGSKGNCTYLNTGSSKILIDAGISGKQIKERLATLNVELGDIDAIVITHEHIDHIQGLRVLAYKHNIPVYANIDTAKGIIFNFSREYPNFKIFTTGETFELNDLKIHPFSIQHDSGDPVAYTIETGGLKLGFCTDLGFATSLVKNKLQGCDYLVLESNHQPSMVHACPRPMSYKQRVLGRSGHLSNEACGELLKDIVHDGLKHVHLAHLSEECNTPETALSVVGDKVSQTNYTPEISIAWQREVSKPVLFEEELAIPERDLNH